MRYFPQMPTHPAPMRSNVRGHHPDTFKSYRNPFGTRPHCWNDSLHPRSTGIHVPVLRTTFPARRTRPPPSVSRAVRRKPRESPPSSGSTRHHEALDAQAPDSRLSDKTTRPKDGYRASPLTSARGVSEIPTRLNRGLRGLPDTRQGGGGISPPMTLTLRMPCGLTSS